MEISYMGTKRLLAPRVAKFARGLPDGILLDLFAGVGTVAAAVARDRNVWCNDAQLFAANVGAARFTSQDFPLKAVDAAALIYPAYLINCLSLKERFANLIDDEKKALASGGQGRIASYYENLPLAVECLTGERELSTLRRNPYQLPFRLFSLLYSGMYLGLWQCIQVDSIRCGIENLYREQQISLDRRRWLCIALCAAMRKIATTTGHFAEFLSPKDSNIQRYRYQRVRSVWREWLAAITELTPVGSLSWRERNCAFFGDALELLQALKGKRFQPAVVYADPPYTEDQYSRYFHIYETVFLYDYPVTSGKARYRDGRFQSSFCHKTKVDIAFESLIERVSALGSALILSYPAHGLIHEPRTIVSALVKKHFASCRSFVLSHRHSSLGGSKGFEKHSVNEILFVAR